MTLLAIALAAHTIGSVSAVAVRADVTAQKTGGGAAPTAVVTVTTYRRSHGRWVKHASRRLGGTYFWKTITAPHAICRLELVTSRSPRVIVQLLQTPSLGCARAQTFRL
jgi:hypothetical protein